MPSGYAIAPNDARIADNVIGPYRWGTRCLMLANGQRYRSADIGSGGSSCGKDSFSQRGNQYKVDGCTVALLIRKLCQGEMLIITLLFENEIFHAVMRDFWVQMGCHIPKTNRLKCPF